MFFFRNGNGKDNRLNRHLVIARRFVEGVVFLVRGNDVLLVLCPVVGKPVDLGTVLLNPFHVLQLDGVIVLVAEVVVGLIGILGNMPDLLNVGEDGPVEPAVVEGSAEDMLLAGAQGFTRSFPGLLRPTGAWSRKILFKSRGNGILLFFSCS